MTYEEIQAWLTRNYEQTDEPLDYEKLVLVVGSILLLRQADELSSPEALEMIDKALCGYRL